MFSSQIISACWIIITILVVYNNILGIQRRKELLDKQDRVIEDLRRKANSVVEEENNLAIEESQEEEKIKHFQFTCPTFQDLNNVPKTCPKSPKYPSSYKSSFFPIYPPRFPGPSEQTQGFKHVFMAAAILKKSIAISNFTTHNKDFLSEKTNVPFGLRTNVERLCQYVNLVEVGENQEIDQMLIVSTGKSASQRNWENVTIKPYLEEYTNGVKFDNYDKMLRIPARTFEILPHSSELDITTWFAENNLNYDQKKLIGLAHPYNWIFWNMYKVIDDGGIYRFSRPIGGRSKPIKIDENEAIHKLHLNLQFIKDTFLATSHPKFIEDLAVLFMKDVMGFDKVERVGLYPAQNQNQQNFIGIHWRFNLGDFFTDKFLEKDQNNTALKGLNNEVAFELQKSMKDFTYFFDKLSSYLSENGLEDRKSKTKSTTVFITSPPNIAEKIKKVSENFNGNYKNFKIFTTLDTQNFVSKYKNNCAPIKNFLGEILSTLEKEILIYSKIYLRARPSNWSFNVHGHRFSRYDYESIKNDAVIFDVFNKK